jgi:hypothetical protein
MVNLFIGPKISSDYFSNAGSVFVSTKATKDIAKLIFALKELNDWINKSIIKSSKDAQN